MTADKRSKTKVKGLFCDMLVLKVVIVWSWPDDAVMTKWWWWPSDGDAVMCYEPNWSLNSRGNLVFTLLLTSPLHKQRLHPSPEHLHHHRRQSHQHRSHQTHHHSRNHLFDRLPNTFSTLPLSKQTVSRSLKEILTSRNYNLQTSLSCYSLAQTTA